MKVSKSKTWQVCWRSAKVQLNSGILERRRQNWPKALQHFRNARNFEPSYCEPDYWVGATMLNAGHSMDDSLKVGLLQRGLPDTCTSKPSFCLHGCCCMRWLLFAGRGDLNTALHSDLRCHVLK